MANIDTLQLSAWVPTGQIEQLLLTRYKMPTSAHEALAQWCREKTNRESDPITIVLQGLSEILATLVPDVAFMKHDNDRVERGKRLHLFFLGDRSGDEALHSNVQAAFSMWLGILYPNKPGGVRASIAASAADRANWVSFEVSTKLKEHPGACAVPEDGMLYDALTAYAARALAGKRITFRSGETKLLVLETAQASPYEGLELVAFPPKRDPNKPDCFWSEVITVSAATFPERPGIHILARPSIRNWGSISRWSTSSDPTRRMDVFIPGQMGDDDVAPWYQHSSFDFRPRQNKAKPERSIVAYWNHKEDERVLDLVRRLSGRSKVDGGDAVSPVANDQGLWTLPRLGNVHGDRYLPGGSGVGWFDRMDIANSIDGAFAEAGFRRVGALARLRCSLSVEKPFGDKGEHVDRRKALVKALDRLGNPDNHLDLFVFHQLDGTPTAVVEEIIKFFGEPTGREGAMLRWADEQLSISVISSSAGPLSLRLPKVEVTEDERVGRTAAQISQVRRLKQDERNRTVEEAMADHVRQVRGNGAAVACAILEMNAELKEDSWTDPYAMAKRELARYCILPQVVLVDAEQAADKYRMAVRDCVRMLGVVPTNDETLGYAPAAITVIQLNKEVVGGGTRAGRAFPLAARVRQGALECAVPAENGEPEWIPYAEAGLRILSGNYGQFGRSRDDETEQKYGAFFANVLEQIDSHGACVVIAEAETIAHKWPGLQNGKLIFDHLPVTNQTFTPSKLPNTRIIRVSPDPKKQPTHYHEGENKDVSGFFTWEGAKRTFYALKVAPRSAKTVKVNSIISRHPLDGGKRRDDAVRQLMQLDEICVVFCQPEDDFLSLALLTHRLRQVHAQFSDDTRKPFPLHELRLLGRSVTL